MAVDQQAREYLLPSADSFWQWWEHGEVLGWQHSKTIAFRAELQQILSAMAPRGLPSLGALALLLAATRDNFDEHGAEATSLLELLDALPDPAPWQQVLDHVLKHLRRVRELDQDLRGPAEAKAVLAETVFEDIRQRSTPEVAAGVVELLERGIGDELHHRHFSHGPANLKRDLETLARGLPQVDAESLRNRLRTGMDAPPLPADESPMSERIRGLLDELSGDRGLRGLAAVARQLLAAVTLPRRVSHPEDLPVGGVTDISNRGSLDRLLLSELAHDNLTLSVRVAMNEALYLRRETPRQVLPQRRAVLLESGIRSWGLPRLYATAVALAVGAAAADQERPMMFRACGASLAPVDLSSREGLLEHLAALDLDLHPGAAWELFRQQAAAEDAAEPVLVASEATAADPAFRRRLADSPLPSLLLITVGRDGQFHLAQRTPRGAKTLRRATLDLAALLDDGVRIEPTLRDRPWTHELPAIFSRQPFPLLLPHDPHPARTWKVKGHGTLSLTRDRRLMHWTAEGAVGAEQISDELPPGRLRWAATQAGVRPAPPLLTEPVAAAAAAVIGGDGGALHLLLIRLGEEPSCEVRPLEASFRYCVGAFCHHGAVLMIGKREVDVIEMATGRRVDTLRLPASVHWRRERFFYDAASESWLALGFDGRGARLTPVVTRKSGQKLVSLVECDEIEGLIGVTPLGNLFFPSDRRQRRVRHGLDPPVQLAAASRDGATIVLASAGAQPSYAQVDVLSAVATSTDWPPSPVFARTDKLPVLSVRTRFTGIARDSLGYLVLIGRSGPLSIRMVGEELRLVHISGYDEAAAFEPLRHGSPIGVRLKAAELADGSHAVLDSRGLLHLRCADASVPQSTLVLHDTVAGWCEPNLVWGPRYFTEGRTTISAQEAYQRAIQPLLDRLP